MKYAIAFATIFLAGCSTQNLNVSWSFAASYNTDLAATTQTVHLKKGQ